MTPSPGVTLLPKLAAFFGVRIDELFSVSHDDELERIDNMLKRETMTDQNFSYAKRVLDGILRENPGDTEAIKRYAKIYLSKCNTDMLSAGKMLERAMTISPLDEEIFALYRSVRGGSEYKYHSDNDWFIRVCEPYAHKFPGNTNLYRMLIEAMVSKKYFDRAEALLEVAYFTGENKYIKDILLGDVAMAKGNPTGAKEIWNRIPKDDWLGQYELGERFNRLNDYENAIESFKNAYIAQTAPHKIDMLYSLAFLYKKLGRYEEAKAEWELIITTLRKEYNEPEDSNDIQWAKNEISQLVSLIGS